MGEVITVLGVWVRGCTILCFGHKYVNELTFTIVNFKYLIDSAPVKSQMIDGISSNHLFAHAVQC